MFVRPSCPYHGRRDLKVLLNLTRERERKPGTQRLACADVTVVFRPYVAQWVVRSASPSSLAIRSSTHVQVKPETERKSNKHQDREEKGIYTPKQSGHPEATRGNLSVICCVSAWVLATTDGEGWVCFLPAVRDGSGFGWLCVIRLKKFRSTEWTFLACENGSLAPSGFRRIK